MINLQQNEYKLILVLKFFVCALSAIEDKGLIKQITKQILLLVYRTYTNVKLSKSEARTISVEIIELLQNKWGDDQTEFLKIYSEVKTLVDEHKSERKRNERISAVRNVAAFKKKRQVKHRRKRENDKKKNLLEKLTRYN